MKIIRQDWHVPGEGNVTSISKDAAQLQETILDITVKTDDDENEEGIREVMPGPTTIGDPEEAEIPNDSAFAQMVMRRTIFLHDDEMGVLYDAHEDD